MNKIDQLLKKYCPNGVEWVQLQEAVEIFDNKRIPIAQNKRIKGKFPYYGANGIQDYINDFIFDGEYILIGEDGSVIDELNHPILNYATGKFWVNNHAHVLKSKEEFLNRFIYHFLSILDISNIVRGTPPKMTKGNLLTILIPKIPLKIQEKIVEILDNFSELEAELEFRNIQYEHYNNKLLDFDNNQSLLRKLSNDNFLNKEVKSYKLKDISKINIGQQLNKELFNNGEYFVYNGGVDPSGKYDKWNVEENHIAISQGGESAGNVKFIKEKFWAGAHCYYIFSNNEEKYNQKYLYYFLKNEQPNLANKANGVAIKGLSKSALEDFEIKVPSIEIQNRIVKVLEKLETYNKDVNTGLLAELNARKSQYNYYLNKLLTFKTGGAIGSEQLECLKLLENIFLYIVEYKKVDELCDITRGKVYSKDYIKNNTGIYPVYSSQTENNGELGKINTYDFDGEYVTWTTDGAYAGSTFYRNGKFSITNVCGLLKVKNFNELVPKYLHYILKINTHNYVNEGMGNPKLMSNVMANIVLPISSLEIQNKIVQILDKLEIYSKDINTGLPLEVSERKKQYDYYLNKLLTFKTGGGNR